MSTNDTEFYFTNFKRLQYATHIVRRDTGEEIKSFKEIAGIYGYMCDQYESYSKKGLEFFESLESIGLHFHGMDRRTVKKFIDVLNAIGLVNSVKQKQKDYGYDRYHHTVIPLEKIADNLIFYGPEKISGGPLAEGMLIRGLEKKKPRGKPKTKKAAQPKAEESGNDEKKRDVGSFVVEPAAPVVEPTGSVPVVDAGNNADLSGSNHLVMNDQPEKGSNDNGRPAWFRAAFKSNGDLVPEAKAWARLRGATSEEEEKHEIWRALEIINPLLDSQSKPQPQPQPSDPSTAADEEEEETADYPF
ncbi:DUF6945 domain-containing protein [Klebsiella pneumoniae]|uniref:DUF6945 domain-containing protein n=1 Tax=Klebsiella pneumoniae TaxID=573 RepID=UPI002DB76C57|nr:hypothetical protein [Klebsiella pneumoniae]MEB6394417.1 hypothetical protein [Klebsiella pneumoniae]HCS8975486.1 hypothetical protein [Klebsiella pneumoniae]